jgi:hypothetical protein
MMTKLLLNSNSVVNRTAGLMSTRIDKDIFILNPVRDNYIGLDDIGRKVWDLLAAPATVDHLCRVITREFAGDALQIPTDLIAFLDELQGEGLLEVR